LPAPTRTPAPRRLGCDVRRRRVGTAVGARAAACAAGVARGAAGAAARAADMAMDATDAIGCGARGWRGGDVE
jgi:hypothetical protein